MGVMSTGNADHFKLGVLATSVADNLARSSGVGVGPTRQPPELWMLDRRRSRRGSSLRNTEMNQCQGNNS